MKYFLSLILSTISFYNVVLAQDKPNVLFLVIEDTSPYLLPAYGNKDIQTPNIDLLAKNGVTFTNAFANAPYCSPARSSLISGNYSTTYGTDWHRNQMIVPKEYFFPQYLRNAGYFTVNAGKTDYNVTQEVQKQFLGDVWDRLSGYAGKNLNATYNDKERGERPFFAQFNNQATHMSRITSVNIANREPLRLDASKIQLPPHVPDAPELRSDYALHLEGVADIDKWIGLFIQDLKNKNLFENTIIFFFSDHGGNLPRGKAFPFESGIKSAFIISAPKKWQHLLPDDIGKISDQLIEFADLGPTLLSIAGAPIPDHMKGVPFMGKYSNAKRDYAFGFRTNSEDHFDPSRMVFNQNYMYVKNYTPYKRHALKQSFQWGMPGQQAWDQLYLDGKTESIHNLYYEIKPSEMLFDMINDPYSLVNLAEDPEYKAVLLELRSQGKKHIRSTNDLGFFPRDVRDDFTERNVSLYEWIHENNYDFESFYQLVESASNPNVEDIVFFQKYTDHDRPEFRFWAYSGLTMLSRQGKFKEFQSLKNKIAMEKFGSVKAIAAEGLVYAGVDSGYDILLAECQIHNSFAMSSLENIGQLNNDLLTKVSHLTSSKNGKIRFGARSILIDHGIMTFEDLFEKNQIEGFIKNHKDRVTNWAPSLPDKIRN